MTGELKNIAVIGLGLVGASFAAACKAKNPEGYLVGVDVLPETRKIALDKGWVDAAYAPDDPRFEAFIKKDCDLIVLATPVEVMKGYFSDISAWGYPGIVTDTASTKMKVSTFADELLTYPSNYIPGHPMAGSEKNGIEGARSDLFQGPIGFSVLTKIRRPNISRNYTSFLPQ